MFLTCVTFVFMIECYCIQGVWCTWPYSHGWKKEQIVYSFEWKVQVDTRQRNVWCCNSFCSWREEANVFQKVFKQHSIASSAERYFADRHLQLDRRRINQGDRERYTPAQLYIPPPQIASGSNFTFIYLNWFRLQRPWSTSNPGVRVRWEERPQRHCYCFSEERLKCLVFLCFYHHFQSINCTFMFTLLYQHLK